VERQTADTDLAIFVPLFFPVSVAKTVSEKSHRLSTTKLPPLNASNSLASSNNTEDWTLCNYIPRLKNQIEHDTLILKLISPKQNHAEQ